MAKIRKTPITPGSRPLGPAKNVEVRAAKMDEVIDRLNDLTDGEDVTVSGDLTVTGDTTLNGNVTIGSDASDIVTINGTIAGVNAAIFESSIDGSETTLAVANPSADRVVTIPDPGADAFFVMTEGAQTINGAKTFGDDVAFQKEENRIVAVTASTTAAAAGGNLNIASGAGNTSGAGGNLTLSGGAAGDTGNGGNLVLSSGAAGGTSGASGNVTVSTGNATSGAAGDISITAGNSTGANEGGDVNITAGNPEAGTGTGGDVLITAGTGATDGASGTQSGLITLITQAGGNATTGVAGNGGDIALTGAAGGAASGAAGTGGNGSRITIVTGIGGATTDAGGGAEVGGAGGRLDLTANDGGSLDAASTGTAGNGGDVLVTPGAGGTAAGGTAGVAGGIFLRGLVVHKFAAPAAKTTDDTLTVAEVLGGAITVNQAGGGTSTLTTPTGTQIQAALPATFAVNDAFDFHVINISAVAAEDAILAAGVNVSIVGDARVSSIDAAGEKTASGTFRFRKSADNTFIVYRIS